jgi:hypothetical protein
MQPMNATDSQMPNSSTAHPEPGSRTWEGHMADDVGATYGSAPMAALSATTDALVLSGGRGNFRVPRAAVTKVGRGKLYPWLFAAVQIHHTVPGISRELQFKPLNVKPREVLDQLRTLGYPV